MVVSLVDIARELYGLEPGEFTAARNARARELKPSDAVLAKQAATLRKPSPAAWVVNLLTRQRADTLSALLQLGEQMRTAQEHLNRDELRRLGGQRREAVAALAREGADLAAGLGHPPTAAVLGEVEQTLQAGTSDPGAAAAVASGLLVRPLRAEGLEAVDLAGAVAVPDPNVWPALAASATGATSGASGDGSAPTVAAPPSPVQLADVRRRKEARRQAERLERDADAAAAELDALERRAQRQALRRASLEAEIDELREQLAATETALAGVAADAGALADARAEALSALEHARTLARDARESADTLEASD